MNWNYVKCKTYAEAAKAAFGKATRLGGRTWRWGIDSLTVKGTTGYAVGYMEDGGTGRRDFFRMMFEFHPMRDKGEIGVTWDIETAARPMNSGAGVDFPPRLTAL